MEQRLIIAIALLVGAYIMVAIMLAATALATPESRYALGDANCDRQVTVRDAVVELRYMISPSTPECGEFTGLLGQVVFLTNVDTNCDGGLDIIDVVRTLRVATLGVALEGGGCFGYDPSPTGEAPHP